ncbi:DUF885 family protein [Sphingomonas sp. MMS24-JH45]
MWSLPQGEQYYASRLRASTTTDLTADQITSSASGRSPRSARRWRRSRTGSGSRGRWSSSFQFVRTDPRFKYSNDAAVRQVYLGDARTFVAQMMTAAPRWFSVLPKAKLEVRAVEKWREGTASTAFYNRPAPDGSRPGIFYVNLVDMTQTQKVQLDAIAAHEGAPGHHFQIARAMELTGLPKFRTDGRLWRLCRRLGALQRAASEGDGRLYRPL